MCPGYACSWEADRRRRIVLSALAAGTAGPAPIAGPGRVLRMPRVARRRAGSPLLCSVGTGASRCESHGHCHVGPALLGTSRRSSVTVHARVPPRSAATPQSVCQFRAGPRGRVSQLCWLRQANCALHFAADAAPPFLEVLQPVLVQYPATARRFPFQSRSASTSLRESRTTRREAQQADLHGPPRILTPFKRQRCPAASRCLCCEGMVLKFSDRVCCAWGAQYVFSRPGARQSTAQVLLHTCQ